MRASANAAAIGLRLSAAAVGLAAALAAGGDPGVSGATEPLVIRTLSSRPDLVSGGDALVEVLAHRRHPPRPADPDAERQGRHRPIRARRRVAAAIAVSSRVSRSARTRWPRS